MFNLSDSDEKILQEVPSMCDLLGLKRITPKRLMWQDWIFFGQISSLPVPADQVFVGGKQMVLSKKMQGVLTPDEWRPLVGTNLLVRAWSRSRLFKTLLAGIIVAFTYYIPLLVLVSETPIQGPIGLVLTNPLFAVIVGLVGLGLFGIIYSPGAYRDMLRADLRVAGVVGRGEFLATLEKIDSLRLEDVRKLDPKWRILRKPSLQQRIENLRTGGAIPPVADCSES